MKSQLAEQEKIILEKTKAATELIKIVGKEQDKVAKEKIKGTLACFPLSLCFLFRIIYTAITSTCTISTFCIYF